jgi:signal transduction histidine kinase
MLQATTEIVGREIHELALELRPTSLDDLGLLRTLSNYVDQWSSRASVEVDFHSSGWTGDRLPPHIEATVYRIVQEALTNILKHARATRVSLIIERRPGQAIVIVEDNGAGFDDDRLMNRPNRNSIGLLGMRERAALIDGELKVEASLGKGTTVFLRIPLP